MPNRWQKFLRDNKNRGYSQEQLQEMYNDKYEGKPTKKQKEKEEKSGGGKSYKSKKPTYVLSGQRAGPTSPKYKIKYEGKQGGGDESHWQKAPSSPRTGGVDGVRGRGGVGGRRGSYGYGGRRGSYGYGRRRSGIGLGAGLLLGTGLGLAAGAYTYPRAPGYSAYCWNYYNTYGYFPPGCGPRFRYQYPYGGYY